MLFTYARQRGRVSKRTLLTVVYTKRRRKPGTRPHFLHAPYCTHAAHRIGTSAQVRTALRGRRTHLPVHSTLGADMYVLVSRVPVLHIGCYGSPLAKGGRSGRGNCTVQSYSVALFRSSIRAGDASRGGRAGGESGGAAAACRWRLAA